jgi:hypothetical protein
MFNKILNLIFGNKKKLTKQYIYNTYMISYDIDNIIVNNIIQNILVFNKKGFYGIFIINKTYYKSLKCFLRFFKYLNSFKENEYFIIYFPNPKCINDIIIFNDYILTIDIISKKIKENRVNKYIKKIYENHKYYKYNYYRALTTDIIIEIKIPNIIINNIYISKLKKINGKIYYAKLSDEQFINKNEKNYINKNIY